MAILKVLPWILVIILSLLLAYFVQYTPNFKTPIVCEECIASPIDCYTKCQRNTKDPSEVSKECYTCAVLNYRCNGYKYPEGAKIKGFQINIGDIENLCNTIFKTLSTEASMYVMMSIRDSLAIDRQNQDTIYYEIPDIFFVLKDQGDTTFYDFTSQCPTFCPNIVPDICE